MEGRVCVCLSVVILFLWNNRFGDEVDGCFATVPVDEIKFTTLASQTTPCSVQPRCSSCPADSACVTTCNVQPNEWLIGPAGAKEPGDCVDFVGTTEPVIGTQDANVGFLTCTQAPADTACLSGGAKNIPYGKYEVLNSPAGLEFFAYCASPTDCKVLLTNRVGSEIPLVYKDGPAVSYPFPPDPTPLTNDGTYFIVDDICCGTCDACVANGCNPPYPCPVVG